MAAPRKPCSNCDQFIVTEAIVCPVCDQTVRTTTDVPALANAALEGS